jgi:hypothetical protein
VRVVPVQLRLVARPALVGQLRLATAGRIAH